MAKYDEMGNEQLAPLAFSGDTAAQDELTKRGNTAISATEVSRTMKGSALHGYTSISDRDDVTVVNGVVTQVNGNPYP